MSDLYKEALLDAKKLREVAEIDAKNRVIEKVAPFISKMIAEQLNASTVGEQSVFIDEQEDDEPAPLGDPTSLDDAGEAASTPLPTTDAAGQMSTPVADVPAGPAPIDAAGSDLMNVSVPDENGMITVDFNDLFANNAAAPEPQAPAADATDDGDLVSTTPTETASSPSLDDAEAGAETDPAASPLQPESVSYNNFVNHINECSFKVDQVYHKPQTSEIVREALKSKLFTLIESLDSLKERGLINSRQAHINENKLEFLFMKLKESENSNSYNRTTEKQNSMNKRTLKEFAAELYKEESMSFAQDSASSGKTGLPTDQAAQAHAKRQSGVSPKIGGRPSDIKVDGDETHLSEEMNAGVGGTVDEDNINDVDHGEKPWEEGEARLKENSADANTDANDDVAEGAAGFGDTNEEPAVEFEVDDREIAEAVRRIRKENIRRKMARLRETTEGGKGKEQAWEDAEPEGGSDASHANLKEQEIPMDDDSEVFGDSDVDVADMVGGGAPAPGGAKLEIDVQLPDELAQLLADLDASEISASVEVESGDKGGSDMPFDMDADGDEEIVLVDDTEEAPAADMPMEARRRQARRIAEARARQGAKPTTIREAAIAYKKRAMVAESRVKAARNLIKSREARINELNEALAAQNLFTAKAVYLNKFLMREGLSKKALRQIVEHLDRARTLAEAKTIYTNIKVRLDEHVSNTSRKLAGSASKVTTPGSAKLNESISRDTQTSEDSIQVERWQQLANIKKPAAKKS